MGVNNLGTTTMEPTPAESTYEGPCGWCGHEKKWHGRHPVDWHRWQEGSATPPPLTSEEEAELKRYQQAMRQIARRDR